MAALGVGGNKDGDDKQGNDGTVEDVGVELVVFLADVEQHDAHEQGTAYPHQLLARTAAETKETGGAVVVAGTTDAEPSEGHHQQADDDGDPVNRLPKTTVPCCHS